MLGIAGVRFREVGKIKYFVLPNYPLKIGDYVIAQTQRGTEFGEVLVIKKDFKLDNQNSPDEKIIRKASAADVKSFEYKAEEEKKAAKICEEKIKEHHLKMELIETELMFDRRKVVFYFVAESRVDFRALVKDLAYALKKRIELRQVGSRDEAKMIRGVGICGKQFCCSTFLNDFHLVTVKMAKDQNMSMNPSKLAGCCGKLLCCIKYEQDTYLELLEKIPGIGDDVETPSGVGTVTGVNAITNSVRVILNDSPESSVPAVFNANELTIIKKAENKFSDDFEEIDMEV